MDPSSINRQAAMYAAGDAVASRFAIGTRGVHRRGPQPTGVGAQLRPVPLHQIPNLVPPPNGGGEDFVQKLERYYTVASLYTLERKKDGFARQMLQGDELEVLERVAAFDQQYAPNGTCSFCRILNGLLYYRQYQRGGEWIPPVESINHAARVSPGFDPDTNVSDVFLDKQQWLVRGPLRALQMVLVLHPVLWHETSPDLFRSSDPALKGSGTGFLWEIDVREGETLWDRFRRWTVARETGKPGYIWETVGWQWNGDITADVQNIIRIEGMTFDITNELFRLEYDYALEECLQSSFGVAFEPTGLDVDGGRCALSAKPVSEVKPEDVKHLTARDLAHLGIGYGEEAEALYVKSNAIPEHRALESEEDLDDEKWAEYARDRVVARARRLRDAWGEEPWLVTSSLSKRFRFTAPINSPIELWSSLTYSAPSLLVMFMNRAVSLPAQLVASDSISPEIAKIANQFVRPVATSSRQEQKS
jgi:hypothetical protein